MVVFNWSTANEGSQLPFIQDGMTRHTAFVGGLGSGKSWSGAVKTVLYALQHPGCLILICAPTYRQLRDSTLREFMKVLPNELIENFNRSEYEMKLKNGTEILFRSLENYEAVRGVEIAFLWIDEANLVSYKAWRVAIGRLRQPGYPHRSCVTTTPRGRTGNWLYEEYVNKPGINKKLSRKTYHAKTRDNIRNVGEEYIEDLEATYTGEFALQELEGQFVDIIEGRVYPQFSREYHVDFFGEAIFYNPSDPLYGLWDYGVGDEGALWLAQKIHVPAHMSIPIKNPETGELETKWIEESTGLALIDLILEEGENVEYWVRSVEMIEQEWGPFDSHWGDPAGEQRNAVTGKSMAQHLRERGIFVRSKKVPFDDGLISVHKLLNERRIFVNSDCEIGIAALQSYHWPLDENGEKKEGARLPVHDWSSHACDALRYGASGMFPAITKKGFDQRNKNQTDRMTKKSRAPRSSFSGIKKKEW